MAMDQAPLQQQKIQSELLSGLYILYRQHPEFFVEHGLGHYTWGKQREILHSVRDNQRTAVRACHGASKTFTAAEVAVWFLNCFPRSKVITTAPTHPQVEHLLWAEINSIYSNAKVPLVGRCLKTMIKDDQDETHFAIGFSTDKPTRAEGWHSPYILFIFDEAKGIEQWMWDSVKGLMTGGHCRWLVISTTDGVQVGEQYYETFDEKNTKWNKIHISAFDTPFNTGEPFHYIEQGEHLFKFTRREKHPDQLLDQIQIASPAYIEECKEDWGEESVLYKTKVLGELSDQGADTIIKLSQINKMFQNAKDPAFKVEGKLQVGVDVARGGEDDSVFIYRKGMKVLKEQTISSPELPEKARLVYLADQLEEFVDWAKKPYPGQDHKTPEILIDDTGVGGGLTDIMQDRKYDVTPINFNAKAKDGDSYPDLISEAWFEVGKIIQEISCKEDKRLQAELANRKGTLDKKGRRMVESKKDYKKRMNGRSPDKADAFLLAFYEAKRKAAVAVLDW